MVKLTKKWWVENNSYTTIPHLPLILITNGHSILITTNYIFTCQWWNPFTTWKPCNCKHKNNMMKWNPYSCSSSTIWMECASHACRRRPHSENPCHTWDNWPKSLDVAEYVSTYNLHLCVEMHIVGPYNLLTPRVVNPLRKGIHWDHKHGNYDGW